MLSKHFTKHTKYFNAEMVYLNFDIVYEEPTDITLIGLCVL